VNGSCHFSPENTGLNASSGFAKSCVGTDLGTTLTVGTKRIARTQPNDQAHARRRSLSKVGCRMMPSRNQVVGFLTDWGGAPGAGGVSLCFKARRPVRLLFHCPKERRHLTSAPHEKS
jgi:hypothetical protein